MPPADHTNAAIWQSADTVARWVATADARERHRVAARETMAELLAFEPEDPFTVVDLGAGTGAASAAVLSRYPGATAVLADYSPHMIAEGERALAPFAGRYRYVTMDLGSGAWPAELDGGLDAVVSSLSVHHLPDDRKAALFVEIHARLAPGRWYLAYDPVSAPDDAAAGRWRAVLDRRDPSAARAREHRSEDEQRQWENHVRHIAPLDRQLALLRRAGFDGVDVYWKDLDHAIVGGRRPG